ncbi:hypothetical protein ACFPYJ_14290 [Paenibacillus solisilvae]|uniref:Uncharacterized protein n=1 Tax=Paenibacillus solisilvae TaxID=2486751 RepID=A0ABW0VWM9_9BACL
MSNSQTFVMVVIPLSEVKKFVIIDLAAGTAIYYLLKLPLHSFLAASAGSMVGPLLIRQTLKLRRTK